MNNTPVWFKT